MGWFDPHLSSGNCIQLSKGAECCMSHITNWKYDIIEKLCYFWMYNSAPLYFAVLHEPVGFKMQCWWPSIWVKRKRVKACARPKICARRRPNNANLSPAQDSPLLRKSSKWWHKARSQYVRSWPGYSAETTPFAMVVSRMCFAGCLG